MSFRRTTDTQQLPPLTNRLDLAATLTNRVRSLLETGRNEEAFNLLKPATNDPVLKNARGVCLLRMQQPTLAVRVYREICLAPGGIMLRNDIPETFKANFATALMLDGNVSGGSSMLNEIGESSSPQIHALRMAVQQWVTQLSPWQRILWWLGGEPNRKIDLGPKPGELH